MAGSDLVRILGQNVIQLRRGRGLTQAQLAGIAGVPRSTINHLESGAGNPTIILLAKLAAALQITIEELITKPRGEFQLVRHKDIPTVERSAGKAILYKLLPDAIPGMEIDRIELEPGIRLKGVPHVVHTKEYLTCLKGRVQVYAGGENFELTEGDVLAFPGDEAHSYFNSGRVRAVALSVVALAY